MRFKTVLGLLFVSVTLLACNLIAGSSPTAPIPSIIPAAASPAIDARFQAIMPSIKTIGVPLRLPPSLDDFPHESQDTLYVTVIQSEKSRYDLAITLQPDCPAHACTQGHLIGEVVTTTSLEGTSVVLANGITGYYKAPVCGANCSDGELSWIENNIRYAVTMRGDDIARLSKVANAMLGVSPLNTQS